jgi:hypothetical protein
MNVYAVTQGFSAPQLPIRLYLNDTVGKYSLSVKTIIGGVEYPNLAFYNWVDTVDSLNYLSLIGTIPDPVSEEEPE